MDDGKKLNFTVHLKPDKHGVYDGREMSKVFMYMAHRLLAAYSEGDLTDAQTMFRAVAYEIYFDQRYKAHNGEKLESDINTIDFPDEAARQEAIARHIDETEGLTMELLQTPVKWVYPTKD